MELTGGSGVEKHRTLPIIAAFEVLAREGWTAMVGNYPWSLVSLATLGLFFLGLINSAVTRRCTAWILRRLGEAITIASRWFVGWLARPLIQAILYNPWMVLAQRYVLKPALFTTLLCLVLVFASARPTLWAIAAIFVGLDVLLNSRFGRNVYQRRDFTPFQHFKCQSMR